jgi:hypothetical protein
MKKIPLRSYELEMQLVVETSRAIFVYVKTELKTCMHREQAQCYPPQLTLRILTSTPNPSSRAFSYAYYNWP